MQSRTMSSAVEVHLCRRLGLGCTAMSSGSPSPRGVTLFCPRGRAALPLVLLAGHARLVPSLIVPLRHYGCGSSDPDHVLAANHTEKTFQRDLEAMASRDGKPGTPVVSCRTWGNTVPRDCSWRWSYRSWKRDIPYFGQFQ